MQLLEYNQKIPVYPLEPDETGNKYFRVYNYRGNLPNQSELLVPHRKDHYLIVFIRHADSIRHWVDMTPYKLKDNTIYFNGLNNIIVKEEFKQLWSTGVAFTNEFLSLQDNAALADLPILRNPYNGHELLLNDADVAFVEDMLTKINTEYQATGDWPQRMLSAYLGVLLTYLSRLYMEQFKVEAPSAEQLVLKKYLAKIDEHFHQQHEVGQYAAQLYISAGHLSEVVKMQSGKPAIKHIHDRLVMEARRLLFHTQKSLKEISFELGFADASYFNRFFKRETGLTPAGYRANIREMYH